MGPPDGTIALLFTDIEGSTRLAAQLGAEWRAVLADHRTIVGGAIEAEGGFVDGIEGDAFFATFADAATGVRAAVGALRALRAHLWPPAVGELKVRMGLHVGYVERTDIGYVGLEVHRAARVGAAAHGGQLLLTGSARELVGDVVPIEPLGSHRLKDFPTAVQLFCAVIDDRGASAFPPPRTETVRATNLPAGLPVLVGRDQDVARVRHALLDEHERVVTVTGRGGAGKTSLALVVASQLLDEFPGGVWLARLASLTNPEEVVTAVASAVGAGRDVERSPLEEVVVRLRDRGPALLVLDNMEHLPGATPAIIELLEALPSLRLLVTSQAPLRVAAELCLPIEALDEEAALGVIERVAARRMVTLSSKEEDQRALIDVVQLLDGLPLALELAAARLAVLTPSQLRDRLRESHELLSDDRADRPARHRSLRATVDWTLDLLEAETRRLFIRMGAFAGPVELEDIEAVAGGDGLEVMQELARLRDVALVRRVESGDGRIRFGLPEALRQIAAGLLDATPDAPGGRRAHAQRAHALVWAARAIFCTRADYSAAVAADPEIASALRWAQAVGDPLAAPLAAARAALLADRGRLREAFEVLNPLVQAPTGEPELDALALWAEGLALVSVGQTAEAIDSCTRALALTTDPTNRVQALSMRGLAHGFRGEHADALRDAEAAVAIARDLGPVPLSGALMLEAQARQFAGELDRAAELQAEAERVGTPVDADFLWRRHTVYGDHALLSGRPADSFEHYARSLEAAEEHDNQMQVLFDLLGVATALATLEDDAQALEVTAMATALMSELGGPGAVAAHLLGQDTIAAARERLGPVATAAAEQRGRTVSVAQRVSRACELARAYAPAGAW